MMSGSFNTIKYSSYETLKDIIKQRGENYESTQHFIDETLRIIEKNPFKENTVKLLLNDKWTCDFDSYINSCREDIKKIKLHKELTSQGRIYDFYERDLTLIHELNHAWYSRFRIYSDQRCLSDEACAFNEFENRLMNEIVSRKNRANPWILKEAVESFGLEPQIYDLASKMAFEDNPHAKISPLAKKERSLLEMNLMDGPDNHYYKIALENSLNKTPDKFWKELFQYEEIVWQRTIDFLIDKKIVDTSPIGNYALVEEDKDIKIIPCLDARGEYYFRNKKDALNYVNYLKDKEGQNLKLVKIQEVHTLSKQF
jgi:hypothetical protein